MRPGFEGKQSHVAGVRSTLFWNLLAPLCCLLDKRFRRYAGNRLSWEGDGENPVVRLPDAASCTSWVVRGKHDIGPALSEAGGQGEAWEP